VHVAPVGDGADLDAGTSRSPRTRAPPRGSLPAVVS
jgi:hypothetical protein